ncbi:MAG: DUF1592 domain-containing protein [Myxococcota bacterium]
MAIPARTLTASALALALGCQGSIGATAPEGPLGPGPRIEDPTLPPDLDACAEAAPVASSQPMRRLTQAQYRNVFADGLGLDALPSGVEDRLAAISEGRTGGFNSSDTPATEEDARGYLAMAERMAAEVVARVGSYVDCAIADGGCFASLLGAIAAPLLRRPLDAARSEELVALFEAFAESDGAEVAAETALTALFASPSVLYHTEPAADVDGAIARLDTYAFANRLAFFLWNSAPDSALLAAAEAGDLDEAEGVRRQVERMLEDSRARRQTENFYAQYLMLEREVEIAPVGETWDRLGRRLVAEAYNLAHRITHQSGTYRELLTANYTYGDEEIAEHYGAPPPNADGRIELAEDERSGLLTLPAVMAILDRGKPEIYRGELVRANFLCDAPGFPAEDIELDPNVDRLVTSPCQNCHLGLDPIGFGFAAFDDMGRYRADFAEGGEVLNGSGSLQDERTVGAFSTPRELGERLAESSDARSCFARQWFQYSLGRETTLSDGCSLASATSAFMEGDGDLRALFTAIATSDAFRSRDALDLSAPGETE